MTPHRERFQRPVSRPKKTGECCPVKIAPAPFILSAHSRKRDLRLKTVVHDLMVV